MLFRIINILHILIAIIGFFVGFKISKNVPGKEKEVINYVETIIPVVEKEKVVPGQLTEIRERIKQKEAINKPLIDEHDALQEEHLKEYYKTEKYKKIYLQLLSEVS